MIEEQVAPEPGVYVVTGATSGIGRALMDLLADAGHWSIGVGRSDERNQAAEVEIRAAYPECRVVYLRADLASQDQVRALARAVEQQLDTWRRTGLSGLVNNAALVTFWREETDAGIEKQWAVNHLAPFLLTNRLLPALARAEHARVVTVSSGSHRGARLEWDNLQLEGLYNPLRAYSQSKMANILFALELDRRTDADLRAFAINPGLVATNIGVKGMPFFVRWAWRLRRRSGIPPHEAAAGVARLLLDRELDAVEQTYWRRGVPDRADPHALDPEAARRLWNVSAEMCGLEPASGGDSN